MKIWFCGQECYWLEMWAEPNKVEMCNTPKRCAVCDTPLQTGFLQFYATAKEVAKAAQEVRNVF